VAAERSGGEQAARRRGEENGGEHVAAASACAVPRCRIRTLGGTSVWTRRLRPLIADSTKYAIGASRTLNLSFFLIFVTPQSRTSVLSHCLG